MKMSDRRYCVKADDEIFIFTTRESALDYIPKLVDQYKDREYKVNDSNSMVGDNGRWNWVLMRNWLGDEVEIGMFIGTVMD